jgi:hypothetical protein
MKRFRTLALSATAIVALVAQSMSLGAQAPAPADQVPSVAVSIALQNGSVDVGQTPRVVLTLKNISQQKACFPNATDLYRVHIEGNGGGPPETQWQRHSHGDLRLGDGPDLAEGPVDCPVIAPGASISRTYDLTKYYDLNVPGKYTAYMEFRDEPKGPAGPGIWLRTNTVQFEIVPPSH